MLFKNVVGCIEPWAKNCYTNRIVSWCIVTALLLNDQGEEENRHEKYTESWRWLLLSRYGLRALQGPLDTSAPQMACVCMA